MKLPLLFTLFSLGGGLLNATAQGIFGSVPATPIPGPLAGFIDQQVLPKEVWAVRLKMTEEELRKARPKLSTESDRGFHGRVIEEPLSSTHLLAMASYSFGKSLSTFELTTAGPLKFAQSADQGGLIVATRRQLSATVEWLQAAFGPPTESFLMNLRPKTPEMEGIALVWQTPEVTIGFSCHITPGYPDATMRIFPPGKKAASMFNTSDAVPFPGAESVVQMTRWAETMIKYPHARLLQP